MFTGSFTTDLLSCWHFGSHLQAQSIALHISLVKVMDVSLVTAEHTVSKHRVVLHIHASIVWQDMSIVSLVPSLIISF